MSASTAGTRSTSSAAAQVHGCSPVGFTQHHLTLVFTRLCVCVCVRCAAAYLLGIILTFVVMLLSGMGQPALLYLVPFTLLTAAAVAGYRKEMRQFWTGTTYEVRAPTPLLSSFSTGLRFARTLFCCHGSHSSVLNPEATKAPF